MKIKIITISVFLIVTILNTFSQVLSSGKGYIVEYIVSGKVTEFNDTLVQVNLLLSLDKDMMDKASMIKVIATNTNEENALRSRTYTFKMDSYKKIKEVESIEKINTISEQLPFLDLNDKVKLTQLSPSDSIDLNEQVFILEPLNQVRLNLGLFNMTETMFDFDIQLIDKEKEALDILAKKEIHLKEKKKGELTTTVIPAEIKSFDEIKPLQ